MLTSDEKVNNISDENNSLIKEIERLKEIERYAVSLKYDFESFKQISAKEKQRIINSSNESFVEKLIPVLSNFERALKYIKVENPSDELKRIVKGVEMIYSSLYVALENEGLKEICVETGKPFDPFDHEVSNKIETCEYPEDSVIDVVENGFKFKGKVIKPAKVVVAVKPEKIEQNSSEN